MIRTSAQTGLASTRSSESDRATTRTPPRLEIEVFAGCRERHAFAVTLLWGECVRVRASGSERPRARLMGVNDNEFPLLALATAYLARVSRRGSVALSDDAGDGETEEDELE